jgi:hypothetical protein
MKLNFLDIFLKNTKIPNFMKTHPMVPELFMWMDGWINRHDEANGHNFANAPKRGMLGNRIFSCPSSHVRILILMYIKQ